MKKEKNIHIIMNLADFMKYRLKLGKKLKKLW